MLTSPNVCLQFIAIPTLVQRHYATFARWPKVLIVTQILFQHELQMAASRRLLLHSISKSSLVRRGLVRYGRAGQRALSRAIL